MSVARRAGVVICAGLVCLAIGAPFLTPYDPIARFPDFENAPPMRVRIVDANGSLTRPFVYPVALVDRLERRFAEDRGAPMPLRWFAGGALVGVEDTRPWFPLGADPLGRDVWARLIYGSRISLGLAAIGVAGALALGLLAGGVAGFVGGRTETLIMALADFILVLPAIFVVLVVRASLPLVLSPAQVFAALTGVLALAGWPLPARGVRAIVAGERRKEYAEAAYAAGASPLRILLRHLAPATRPFLAVTATLLFPAFILTESTLSLVGLGFPTPSATWGTMMRDAWQGGALTEAPWLLAPAAALVLSVVALHLLGGPSPEDSPGPGTFS